MIKSFKYRLSPTKNQVQKLDQTIETCRVLHNSCLVDRKNRYEQTGNGLSFSEQSSILTKDKSLVLKLNDVHSQVLQNVLKRVDVSFKNFFRRIKKKQKAGYPRLKPENRYYSFTYTQSGFEILETEKRVNYPRLKPWACISKLLDTIGRLRGYPCNI